MVGPLKSQPYNWIDKDQIIDEIRTAIHESGEPVEHIARSAGVCPQTLRNWLSGRTKKPYSTSVERVARALGKRLSLVNNELRLVEPPPPAPPPSLRRREPIIAWNWRRTH